MSKSSGWIIKNKKYKKYERKKKARGEGVDWGGGGGLQGEGAGYKVLLYPVESTRYPKGHSFACIPGELRRSCIALATRGPNLHSLSNYRPYLR